MSDLTVNPMMFPALPWPRRWGARWRAALLWFFTADADADAAVDTADRRPPRSHARREGYLEHAAMRREMYRL
jgi:hypothetical protein